MSSPYRASFEVLRTIAHGSITNAYTALGTDLVHPSRILKITNTTDADLLISIDGTNDYDVIPKATSSIYDLCTNRRTADLNFVFAAGEQFYVKYVSAPSTGSLYLTSIYGE